jgi:hypothetical protein
MAGPSETVPKRAISEKSTPQKIILEKISSKNSASEVSVTRKDYLTVLPPEILLKVIPLLPVASFFELTHTSTHLRAFMKLHAATICNDAIEQGFSHISDQLDTQYSNGWLVPRKPIFSRTEGGLRERKIGAIRGPSGGCDSWKRWKSTDLRIQLTDPGPQYLFFLEIMASFMDPYYVCICPPNGLPFKRFPYEQLLRRGLWGFIYDFVGGTDEELAPALSPKYWKRHLYNAKELSWYYGVPECGHWVNPLQLVDGM